MRVRDDGGDAGKASAAFPLREVATLFLWLGVVGFGGPAAHLALMEEEVVRRRRWLSRESFLALLGATHLIPGPNSTEMAIHLGRLRAGWPGFVTAGACFILPAFILSLALAVAYRRHGGLPQVAGLLDGVKPVVVAVVAQAVWHLGRQALRTPLTGAVAVGVVVGALAGGHEVLLLFLAAALVALVRQAPRPARSGALAAALGLGTPVVASAAPASGAAFATVGSGAGLAALGLVFLKVGALLFGSGYVLVALLRPDLVERTGWMTDRELLDAIAAGQLTPGPVLSAATFAGYLMAGFSGATVATVAIFLPAFVFVALSGPLVPRLRRSARAGGFLDGASAAAVALMGVVTVRLARAAIADPTAVVIALVAAALLLARVNSAWLILGGAAVGGLLALR